VCPRVLADSSMVYVLLVIVGVVFLGFVSVLVRYFSLWIQCHTTNAGIGFLDLIGMSLRKVNVPQIVYARIMAVKADLDVPTESLEAHHLAGGDVRAVVRAMIVAKRTGHDLGFRELTAMDLFGADLEALARAVSGAERGGYRVRLDPTVKVGFVKVAGSGVVLEELVGRRGEAAALAQARGTVLIDGIRHPAVFEEAYVAEGQPVEVVRVEGADLVVREITADAAVQHMR